MTRWVSRDAVAIAFAVLSLAAPTAAQSAREEPNRGGQLDLTSEDPRVALERLRPAPGYEVNLFASEEQFPDLAKPLAMTFDARGRLWVLTSPTYPHLLPGSAPKDKLVILEDTNADGRADKLTIFADGLHLPMGFELGDGGVYVSQQPNMMFLRDANGDDRADERRIILHGFGTEDSHHAMHAFQWGPGGGLYFQEGTFLHSQVETPYGPVRLENAGVWEYEPKAEHLRVFVSYPFANPWGHVIDRWGQNFVSDASNGNNHYGTAYSGQVDYPAKQRPIKEWTLTKVRPTSGIEFVSSRHFPDDAQGRFLINNVIGFHGTKQYRVVEDGSGFVGIEEEPLLQSSDSNFRPVALQFGPDGALYVVDWFNPLIGHMQYSVRDPRRDDAHGRVWRVTAKGRPLAERPRIDGQPIAAQLELLKAYEDRTRYWTRRALRERPTDEVIGALGSWVSGLDASDPHYEHHLLEALWVYQHHDVVEPTLLKRLLGAKEFRARAAAVRVLHHWFDRVDDSMALLARMANDEAPRVRLETVRALSYVPQVAATRAALDLLRHPTDYYLQYALDSTITTLEKVWKPALTAGQPVAAGNPVGLAYLLARLKPAELTMLPRSEPVYHELLSRPGVERRYRDEALAGLTAVSGRSARVELLSAIQRVDGVPGGRATSGDLVRMLLAPEVGSLVSARSDLERLALGGRNDIVRQGAWVALMNADGGVERAWQLASTSPRGRVDLLNGTALVDDEALNRSLYLHVVAVVARQDETPAAQTTARVVGRYVRVLLPGRDRTLGLAEVEVQSGGQNIASRATPSQSSGIPGGDFGGGPAKATDGNFDVAQAGAAAAFTTRELDPWWELDLGSEQPIDTLTIRPYLADGEASRGDLHVAVLNEARETMFTSDGLSTAVAVHVVRVGGDFSAALRRSAIEALSRVPGHDEETVPLLAGLAREGRDQSAAIDALSRIPRDRWPARELGPTAESLLAYARRMPAGERTGAEFKQVVSLGRDLATRLPSADGTRISSALDALAVRTIRIEAVLAQMKFDIAQFSVAPGEDVEIVFVNPDHMPHNLLITAPGKLEDVSLKAEAMARQPDGFQKHFVPDTPDVLHATKLINHDEIARLRFSAPTSEGKYPYVCTFPGHWRTMNGVMDVVKPAVPTEARR
jgi:glucose/arabinose dehydrogenase/azurin